MLEKFKELLGDNSQLVLLKGQLRNIERKAKDTGEIYYTADLRVPRLNSDDIYGTSFNIMNVCFSTEYVTANGLGDSHMKQLKDNEVILLISLVSSIFVNKNGDNIYKNNRVLFYVEDHMLSRSIEKHELKQKSYNI